MSDEQTIRDEITAAVEAACVDELPAGFDRARLRVTCGGGDLLDRTTAWHVMLYAAGDGPPSRPLWHWGFATVDVSEFRSPNGEARTRGTIAAGARKLREALERV